MHSNANTFLNKVLGDDFLETLSKTDLYKPNANVAIDLEDIRIGLKVVPRVVMSLLLRELPGMKLGEAKEIPLLLGKNAKLNVNKHDTDTYSGTIVDDGVVVARFQYRPLPGVGLVIMSAFELYEEDDKTEQLKELVPNAEMNVQKLIDERMALHCLVSQVVDKKLMEREAIQQLFLSKLKEALPGPAPVAAPAPAIQEPVKEVEAPKNNRETLMHEALTMSEDKPKKVSPLKNFLAKKEAKKKEVHFQVLKSEISCPDCGQDLIKSSVYVGCICMGSDQNSKVYIKKNEDGVTVRFGKKWDAESIEMLLDVLKNSNKK